MANELTLFQKKQAPKVPDDLWRQLNEENRNIPERMTVPSLLPGGRKWTVSVDGKQQVIQTKTSDGDLMDATTIKAIIIAFNPKRSRAYYPENYNPENPTPPLCWSNDGEKPDKSIEKPQCGTCKECPMTVKGSKIDTRGQAVVACQSQKFLAVLPYVGKIWKQPLRLKLAITSLYDGKSPDLAKAGWFAFDQYVEFLRSNQVFNTAAVITKLKFDPNVDYPKIIFSADDYLTTEQVKEVLAIKAELKDEIESLISREWTPAGGDGVKTDEAAPAEEVEEETVAEIIAPRVETTAPAADEKAEAKKQKSAAKKAAAEAAAKAAAEAAAAAAKAAEEEDEEEDDSGTMIIGEDDEGNTVIDAKPITKEEKPATKSAKKANVSNDVPKDVADILGAWADA